ncbi:outer membrane protein assembly factor BamE [Pseudomonadota bacterium]
MLLALSSCASWLPEAHRQDVTQGNEIKREALDKIHVGMTKSEITPILGNPTLKDPFHANRWDYIYRYVPGRDQAKQSRVTLFFDGDKLIRIDDSEYKEPESLIEIKEE